MGISVFEAIYRTQLAENYAINLAVQSNTTLLSTLKYKQAELQLITKNHLVLPNS